MLRTGDVARQTGVNVETLRFYEREGLLPIPPRQGRGNRQYPPESVDRIKFIKRAQELGFSLREIKSLLELGGRTDASCADVKAHTEAKIEEVENKIRDLQAVQKALNRLTRLCPGEGSVASCPILNLVRFGLREPTKKSLPKRELRTKVRNV